MDLTWDVEIPMSDGGLLRANVYLPRDSEPVPVLVTMGPYGKDQPMSSTMPDLWARLEGQHPDVFSGSSGRYLLWEVPDPERWTPHGYAIVHIDARGTGRSPGVWAPLSDHESADFAEAVEWLAVQPWCTGRVGVLGVSFHAMAAWRLAERKPEHLAAIVPWFGSGDAYREAYRHGGILSNGFLDAWWYRWVRNQHGGGQGLLSPLTGENPTGPHVLDPMDLERLRTPFPDQAREHPLIDEWSAAQAVDWSKVTVPFLSVGSWGTVGLHLRGNVEAFRHAASREKWLILLDAQGPGVDRFLDDDGFAIQLRFFDHYLHGKDNDWPTQPPVTYEVREPDGTRSTHTGNTWPVEGSRWTRLYLDTVTGSLSARVPAVRGHATYWPTSDGVVFRTAPVGQRTEIVGPPALHLEISTQAKDLDVFVSARVVLPDDGATGVTARGWLRLSHRELDDQASTPWSPVHTHQRLAEVVAGRRYAVDIEIWPTALIVPSGGVLQLTILVRDPFDVGEWRHDDPDDRSNESFAEWATIHSGPDTPSWLLMPVVA